MKELTRKKYIEKIFERENMASVTVLVGLRYCGKSTILRQAYEYKKQEVSKENIKYIDFRKIGHDKEENHRILREVFHNITLNIKESMYLFIDNIEYLESWGRLLNYNSKYNHQLNIYITANLSHWRLNKNLSDITYKRKIEIYPFSFKETLDYYQLNSNEKINKLTDNELFEEYQRYGGLPEVLETDELEKKAQIITWSYEDTMNSNIYQLYFKDFAKQLLEYLIFETGHIINQRMIHKFINHEQNNICWYKLSYEFFENYFSLITSIKILEVCGNKDLINDICLSNYKYYVTDPSFLYRQTYKINTKEMLESIIFMEFKRRNYPVFRGVSGGEEITFVHNQKKKTYIQFEKSISDEKIREEAYKKLEQLPNGQKYIISTDTENYSKNNIKHINLIDFLKDDNLITNGCDVRESRNGWWNTEYFM